MIRLLAITDEPSHYLDNYFSKTLPSDMPIDLLLSCGDLDLAYLDFCATMSGRVLHYVNGNHHFVKPNSKKAFGIDLHGQAVVTRLAILCGFGGARWYKPFEYQFYESEMRWLTWRVRRQIWRIRLWEKLRGLTPKPVIVLSHAPPEGIHDQANVQHQGFACFKTFMHAVKPALWLHGHVHLLNMAQIQKTQFENTLVLNVFQFKYITLEENSIQAGYTIPRK